MQLGEAHAPPVDMVVGCGRGWRMEEREGEGRELPPFPASFLMRLHLPPAEPQTKSEEPDVTSHDTSPLTNQLVL
jgi:hypothetical protein